MLSLTASKKPQARWGLWRGVIGVAVLMVAVVSCSKGSADKSRKVADRFMNQYYARMNVAGAVKLCSGAARTRLEGELQTIKGVKPDKASGEPRVSFSLTASSTPSTTQAVYTYKVTAQTSDVGNVVTTLTLAEADGRWTVTSISEQEGPPKS
jgi:hypothetical protein